MSSSMAFARFIALPLVCSLLLNDIWLCSLMDPLCPRWEIQDSFAGGISTCDFLDDPVNTQHLMQLSPERYRVIWCGKHVHRRSCLPADLYARINKEITHIRIQRMRSVSIDEVMAVAKAGAIGFLMDLTRKDDKLIGRNRAYNRKARKMIEGSSENVYTPTASIQTNGVRPSQGYISWTKGAKEDNNVKLEEARSYVMKNDVKNIKTLIAVDLGKVCPAASFSYTTKQRPRWYSVVFHCYPTSIVVIVVFGSFIKLPPDMDMQSWIGLTR
ncbi:hypothetical protein O0I10_002764 [Lichtheimia ornata]|uniref:Uncharacterized protein n=1 Tax=Lichtheimia ornata TaxID=688661 RepID=A0AAD7VAA1_9FUNG|nr:uncharacterized protein O0I10_002764 [Lichtheimia ornata]KAJ8661498.1 hypothetical protein O0I10_002764 [Lichtheimia ornata]